MLIGEIVEKKRFLDIPTGSNYNLYISAAGENMAARHETFIIYVQV